MVESTLAKARSLRQQPFTTAGNTPSCCISEKRLATPQCSAIWPLCTRMTSTVSN